MESTLKILFKKFYENPEGPCTFWVNKELLKTHLESKILFEFRQV
jgi:hypothetical protein